MKKIVAVVMSFIMAIGSAIGLSGCSTTPTSSTPLTDQQVIDRNVTLITSATESVVAIGLTAIPDKKEADLVEQQALLAVNGEILPLLSGDEGALVTGLQDILALKAFDNPALSKFKAIAEMGLPFLRGFMPTDLVDAQLNKVRPDVKAYLTAFFTGVEKGCNSYTGMVTKDFGPQYKDLRAKLAK